MWEVEYTDQFGDWYEYLGEEDQNAVIARVELLEQMGPALGRPAVDNVHQSKHSNMPNYEPSVGCGCCSPLIRGARRSC